MTKTTKYIIGGLGIAAAVLVGFFIKRKADVIKRLKKTADYISLKIKTIGKPKLSLDKSSIDIYVDIINNNPYAIHLSNISADIYINGEKIGYTQYNDKRIIYPNQTQTIAFNVNFNTLDLTKVFKNIDINISDLSNLSSIKDKIINQIKNAKINGQGKYDIQISYKGVNVDLKEQEFSF